MHHKKERSAEMNRVVVVAMLLLFLSCISTMNAADGDCKDLSPNLHACALVLRSGVLVGPPPADCCNGLQCIMDAQAYMGVSETCQCVKQCLKAHMLDAVEDDVDANLAVSLQTLCGVNLAFNISTSAIC